MSPNHSIDLLQPEIPLGRGARHHHAAGRISLILRVPDIITVGSPSLDRHLDLLKWLIFHGQASFSRAILSLKLFEKASSLMLGSLRRENISQGSFEHCPQ
jgi:hypothetical protein